MEQDKNPFQVNLDVVLSEQILAVIEEENLSEDNIFLKYVIDNENRLPIRNILAKLISFEKDNENIFGLLETPYMDLEYWDGYLGYYGDSFKPYKRECERLHFFLGDESKANEFRKAILDGKTLKKLNELFKFSYKGYLVFRPISSYVVSRSAIEFETVRLQDSTWPSQIDSEAFLTAEQTCKTNLCNVQFEVKETVEFIQQDPNIGNCAVASVWVASHLMHERFKTHLNNFRAISRNATGEDPELKNSINDVLISKTGLSSKQIGDSLGAAGSKSMSFALKGSGENAENAFNRMRHRIYSFIESGLPVILCIKNLKTNIFHSVVALGHILPSKIVSSSKGIFKKNSNPCFKLRDIANLNEEEKKDISEKHISLSGIVDCYYVHDDAAGPFSEFKLVKGIRPDPENRESGSSEPEILTVMDGEEYHLKEIVVPVPPMVKIDAVQTLERLLIMFDKIILTKLKEKDKYDHSTNFIWRSLLVEGSEFKRYVGNIGYSKYLCQKYASLHLPKYIWLYEVSSVLGNKINNWNGLKSSERRIDGEFLFDATTPPHGNPLLSMHYLDYYSDYSDDYQEYKSPDFKICECFTRKKANSF